MHWRTYLQLLVLSFALAIQFTGVQFTMPFSKLFRTFSRIHGPTGSIRKGDDILHLISSGQHDKIRHYEDIDPDEKTSCTFSSVENLNEIAIHNCVLVMNGINLCKVNDPVFDKNNELLKHGESVVVIMWSLKPAAVIVKCRGGNRKGDRGGDTVIFLSKAVIRTVPS